MKYILNENIVLRAYKKLPNSIVNRINGRARSVDVQSFELLKQCDGKHDIVLNDLLEEFLKLKIIYEANDSDELKEYQKYKSFDFVFTPTIYLRITGLCNLNCMHCFNAKDLNKDYSYWTYDEFKKLLKQAKEIGAVNFEITGGEPFMSPDLLKIIKEIYANDMVVSTIFTNAHFITQEFLDELKALGSKTQFSISFDAIGHNDVIRQLKGSEEKTINSIKLLIKNGFRVFINMQCNKITQDTILESANMLEELGVSTLRIIKTMETPRWRDNSMEYSFTIKEYFDFAVNFIKEFYKKEHKMNIIIWSFARFISKEKTYSFEAVKCNLQDYNDNFYSCSKQRFEVAIGSDGSLYACHQASGLYNDLGIKYPNIKQVGLKEAIQNKDYIADAHTKNKDVAKMSKVCRECKHFRQCLGGCRAVAFMLNGNTRSGADLTKCEFFNGDYANKVKNALPDNFINRIKIADDASYFTDDLKFLNNCDV